MPAARARRITRGELARRTGVNIETIRYFENIGALAKPERTEGGHRIYDEGHVRTLGFIRRARSLGFSPQEVRAILALGGPGKADCGEVRTIAEHHLEQVRAKLADLSELERLLTQTVEHCSGDAAPDCAVMDLIEESSAAETTLPCVRNGSRADIRR
ncbi:MAG TPA: helix-turn-helix domain-containing protein [Allosphingosinicella sp.]